jgi:chorismate synthase
MNSFGRIFKVELFGESHGEAVGAIIDGCPPGIPIALSDFEPDLARRRSGAAGTTPRREADIPTIVSGLYEGYTTGSPLCVYFRNSDTRSKDYGQFSNIPRPGHADFTSRIKYAGFSDPRGSGHFSGRVTAGLVIAGSIAKKILSSSTFSTRVFPGGSTASGSPYKGEPEISEAIEKALAEGDSIGAIVEVRVSDLPPGLGEPFFDACESIIAHAVFAIPGVRGLEFGDGFASASYRGSRHNDPFIDASGKTASNGAGGINGGITNGNELVVRIAVKPTSSISIPQNTFDFKEGAMTTLCIEGRHDACIAIRSSVVLESAIAISLADLFLVSRATSPKSSKNPWRNP